jgi:hypothetical protein
MNRINGKGRLTQLYRVWCLIRQAQLLNMTILTMRAILPPLFGPPRVKMTDRQMTLAPRALQGAVTVANQ